MSSRKEEISEETLSSSDSESAVEVPSGKSRRLARQRELKERKKGTRPSKEVTEADVVVVAKQVDAEVEEPRAVLNENGDSFSHDAQPPITEAASVDYCPNCGFPKDFCDFGSCWDKCKTTALTQHARYYTHYLAAHPEEAAAAAAAAAASAADQNTESHSALPNHETATAEAPRTVPSSTHKIRKQKEVPKQVTIQRVSRAKHKVATIIIGLDHFDVKLEAATKILKKRFACGCSAVKGLPGQPNHVELQGDYEHELDHVILDNFPQVPEAAILHLNPK